MRKTIIFLLILLATILFTSCSIQQRVVEVDLTRQDMHLLWIRNNTSTPNYPTGRKIQNNSTFELKPKWYAPQQSPNGMVTPQFRYQTNDGAAGFNGPGMFQRGY
jgi:hypothetical protein